MAVELDQLEELSLISKVCTELENHLGLNDKDLGMFISTSVHVLHISGWLYKEKLSSLSGNIWTLVVQCCCLHGYAYGILSSVQYAVSGSPCFG